MAAEHVGVVLNPHPGGFRCAECVDSELVGRGAVVHGQDSARAANHRALDLARTPDVEER
jgi:hypothetical protein